MRVRRHPPSAKGRRTPGCVATGERRTGQLRMDKSAGTGSPRCGSLVRSRIITPPPDGALESQGWEFKGTTPTFLN